MTVTHEEWMTSSDRVYRKPYQGVVRTISGFEIAAMVTPDIAAAILVLAPTEGGK